MELALFMFCHSIMVVLESLSKFYSVQKVRIHVAMSNSSLTKNNFPYIS